MTQYILRQGTWVGVCDGRKALLLENIGSREFPQLVMREAFEQKNPPTHLQGSSPPGRTANSISRSRSAVEAPDFHDQAEKAFLHDFANSLDRHTQEHGISSLILIAPARALGMIRPALSVATKHAIVAELDKDYVKSPIYEIEKLVQRYSEALDRIA
jgi:protein required for attachment to host cells